MQSGSLEQVVAVMDTLSTKVWMFGRRDTRPPSVPSVPSVTLSTMAPDQLPSASGDAYTLSLIADEE